jgi:hypothetical protein
MTLLSPEPETTLSIPDRSTFENIYTGQPRWEIGRPQRAFLNVADQITGTILDSGCGTGENAFYFASRALTAIPKDVQLYLRYNH